MEKNYDIVVFGASGFTGQFVVEEVANIAEGKPLKWAIAGRSLGKLNEVLEEASKNTGKNLANISKIVADCSNSRALVEMCKQTKLVINCAGPYRFYGEPVVKACIEGKAHHVDISGEPQYLETMQLKYFDEAQKAGIFIIGACGYDSIPSEMGTVLGRKHMNGDVNSVESYMKLKSKKPARINFGTFASAVHGVSHFNELKPLRKQINEKFHKKPLPSRGFSAKSRGILFYSDIIRSWCVPFLGPDKTVVTRSTLLNYEHNNERPPQIKVYLALNLFMAIGLFIGAPFFYLMCKFSLTRSLLLRFPEFFTLGMFTKTGPTREELKTTTFAVTVVSEGWKEKLSEPTDKHAQKPDKKVSVTVKGPDPGYTATAIFLVQSGLAILNEKDKLPGNGGVLPPGFAFQNTNLVDNLKARGIEFIVTEM